MIVNEVPEIPAGLRCPRPHYLFYDEARRTYYVSKGSVLSELDRKGLRVIQVQPYTFARSILVKGPHGEEILRKYIKGNNERAQVFSLGKGASADYFVYDPGTKDFWFIEVKTSSEPPKLSGKLSKPELRFAKDLMSSDLQYLIEWIEEGREEPRFFTLDSNGFLVKEDFFLKSIRHQYKRSQ